LLPPPRATLFPYTTLFRSDLGQAFWKNPAKADHSNINVITTTSFSNAGTDASAQRIITALTNQTNGRLTASRVSELAAALDQEQDRKSTRLNSSHQIISYA